MGWGCPTNLRNKFLSDVITHTEPQKHHAFVTDMCGKARQHACGKTPRSAVVVANGMCKTFWKKTKKVLVLMFDDPKNIHPIRGELHKRRYKPLSAEKQQKAIEKGKVIVDNQAYAPDLLPYTAAEVAALTETDDVEWRRLWPARGGKKKAFELIATACMLWHHRNGGDDKRLIMWNDDTVTSYPYHCTETHQLAQRLCNNTGGEADTKTAEAAKVFDIEYNASCFVDTIDTDMILQLTAAVELSQTTNMHLRLMNETIDVRQLITMFGGDDKSKRLSAVFWMLAVNGCDYCDGLKFGWLQPDMIECAKDASHLVISAHDNTATFDTAAFIRITRTLKRRNVKNKTFQQLSAELHRMLFCVSYFSGADKQRAEFAGPDVTSGNLFAINGTFTPAAYDCLTDTQCFNQEIKIIA